MVNGECMWVHNEIPDVGNWSSRKLRVGCKGHICCSNFGLLYAVTDEWSDANVGPGFVNTGAGSILSSVLVDTL
jgi:hypothetical protein